MTTGTITLYIMTSVDGFVAAEDGGGEWLEEFRSTNSSLGVQDRSGDQFFLE